LVKSKKAEINNKCVIATIKSWNIKQARKFMRDNSHLKVTLITDKNGLSYGKIKKINPKYLFFPHWSWKIPASIYKNYECVIFHMTDLPFGRGGSPLQNLIARGFHKTKISAVRAVDKIDAGPVYLKRSLDLRGPAREIFKEASKIVFRNMIPYIIKNGPVPTPQKGRVVNFKRRTPKQSNIAKLKNIKQVYDYIRMLDAEGYPSAFIETPKLKVEFSDAVLKKTHIAATAKIKIKNRGRK